MFFRASTRDQAKQLELSGWVRNLNSGEVETIVFGDHIKIEKLEEWLWHGPKFAKVTEVKAEQLSNDKMAAMKGFEIRGDR